MGIRGPKSAGDLATPTVADLRGDARPEPPADLTEEQAAEWRAVVERLPADWFPREVEPRLDPVQRMTHAEAFFAAPGADTWRMRIRG
jgi:hypothetical protein